MSPVRLRLKTLMAIVLASALLFAWVHERGSVVQALLQVVHSPWIWLMAFIGSLFLARATGWTIRGRLLRIWSSSVFTYFILITFYGYWAFHRSFYHSFWLSETFPYPDPAINALERWFDARHPLRTPGSIKSHGEFPRVWLALASAILILATLDGLLLGFLSNRVRRGSDSIEI